MNLSEIVWDRGEGGRDSHYTHEKLSVINFKLKTSEGKCEYGQVI